MRHTTKKWLCLAALSLMLPLSADAALANEMYGASGAFGQGATGFVDGGGKSYTNDMRVGDWKNHVGGRTYWRSVIEPRQMRMGGMAFVDPAAVPLLFPDPPVRKRRSAKRRAAPAAPAQAQATAPVIAPATASPKLELPKTRPEIAPLKPEAAPKTDAGAEAAPAPAAPQAASQKRRRPAGPKVTTEVWEPTPPVTSAVSPTLPFLKGN